MGHDPSKPRDVIITLPLRFNARALEHLDELVHQCGLREREDYFNAAHKFFSFHVEETRRGNQSAILMLPEREFKTVDFAPLDFVRKNPDLSF